MLYRHLSACHFTSTSEPGGAADPAPVEESTAMSMPIPIATAGPPNLFVVPNEPAELDPLLVETSKHLKNIGRVNILVAGQTGVGKSTLINEVFGENFAQTAAGRPVTQHAAWFESDTVPLRILDTKGLEAKDYAGTLHDMRAEIEKCRNEREARDQLHMAWVCIATPSSRVQDAEVDIVRVLNKYDIPVIVVLTKDDDDEEFAGIVGNILTERRASYAAIVPVRALSKRNRPATGLSALVRATFTTLPAAHRAAFAAAQKINRDLNREAAEDYVTAAVTAAAAAAAIPIPFADVATMAPVQAGMLIGVSSAFGLTLDQQQIVKLVAATLGCMAISLAGRWAVGSALKFVPGAGTIVGSALNAAVAGATTRAIGKAYINFLYQFIEERGRVPTADEILEIFPAFYKEG
jgi:small GTP-binding protein